MTLITTPPVCGAPITVADLNPKHDGDPRIQDLRLAERLEFERARNIRHTIKANLKELKAFGEVPLIRQRNPSRKGGGAVQAYWLNRKQALFIIAKSNTERAALILMEMVEVFDHYLEGETVHVARHTKRPPSPGKAKPAEGPAPSMAGFTAQAQAEADPTARPRSPEWYAAFEEAMALGGPGATVPPAFDNAGLSRRYRALAVRYADARATPALIPPASATAAGFRRGPDYWRERANLPACPVAIGTVPTPLYLELVEEFGAFWTFALGGPEAVATR